MGTIQDLIDLAAPCQAQLQPSEQPMSLTRLEQQVTDLSLRVMLKSLETGHDQTAGALRRLVENLADFQQEHQRLDALLEQAQTAGQAGHRLWQQMRELEILLRAYEHHVRLVQESFQLRAKGMPKLRAAKPAA